MIFVQTRQQSNTIKGVILKGLQEFCQFLNNLLPFEGQYLNEKKMGFQEFKGLLKYLKKHRMKSANDEHEIDYLQKITVVNLKKVSLSDDIFEELKREIINLEKSKSTRANKITDDIQIVLKQESLFHEQAEYPNQRKQSIKGSDMQDSFFQGLTKKEKKQQRIERRLSQFKLQPQNRQKPQTYHYPQLINQRVKNFLKEESADPEEEYEKDREMKRNLIRSAYQGFQKQKDK